MELSHGTVDDSRISSQTGNNGLGEDTSALNDNDIIFHPQTLSNSALSTLSFTSQLSPENLKRNVHPHLNKGRPATSATHSLPHVIDSTCNPDWLRSPECRESTKSQKRKCFLTGRRYSPSSAKSDIVLKFDFQKSNSCILQPSTMKYKIHELPQPVRYLYQKQTHQSENKRLSNKTNLYKHVARINNTQILSLSSRTVKQLKEELVLANTTQQVSKIPDKMLKNVVSPYQVPLRHAEGIMLTTANISQYTTGQVLFTSPVRPQDTRGEAQSLISSKSEGNREIFVYPTSSGTQPTPGQGLFTTTFNPQAGQKEVQIITDNDPHSTVREGQCSVPSHSPGSHAETVHAAETGSKDFCGEGHYNCVKISGAQCPPEENHCRTYSKLHIAPGTAYSIKVSGAQDIPAKVNGFTTHSPQGIPQTGNCSTISKTGGNPGVKCIMPSLPKATFKYVLCSGNNETQTRETVSASGNQKVLLVPRMFAIQENKRKPPIPSSSHQAHKLMSGGGNRPPDDAPFVKKGHLVSLDADVLSQSQNEPDISTLSSTDCLKSPSQAGQKTNMLNSTWVTEQTSNMMPIDLSQSSLVDRKNLVTNCVKTNDSQILLPKTEEEANTVCLSPEKIEPNSHACLYQEEIKASKSTQELPQAGDSTETRATDLSDSVVLQEHLSTSAVPTPADDLHGYQTEACFCKTEGSTICHEIKKFEYAEIKTEKDCCCLDPEDDKDKHNHEKGIAVDGNPRKEWIDTAQYNLVSQPNQQHESKPHTFICVKLSPSNAFLDSEKMELQSQENHSSSEGSKMDFEVKSLLDYNASGNIHNALLPNSPMSNNCAVNNCVTFDIEKLSTSTCERGRQEIPLHVEYPNENLYSGLKILETVSLADMVPSKQNMHSHLKSAEGFYCCCGQRGTCTFRAQHRADFAVHLRDAHSQEKDYRCAHCGCQESSPDLLLYHLDDHLDFQRFSLYCTQPDCNFHSFSPDEVINHMGIFHPRNNAHVCWCCSQWVGTLQRLKTHIHQNLLCVTLCPYCDAKDTNPDRILHHITMTHPGKGRMIVFHKLLMCGERKMSGCQTTETFVHSSVPVLADDNQTNSVKTKETVHLTESCDRSDNDNTSLIADMNTDDNDTDFTDHLSGFSDGHETRRKVADEVSGPNQEQSAAEESAKSQKLLHQTLDKESSKVSTVGQELESNITGCDPISSEDDSSSVTAEQHEQVNSTKLIFKRKGIHFECFDKQTTNISDRDKLSMEPVDLEISVDESVEVNQDCSVEQNSDLSTNKDKPETSREGVKTPPSSPLVSSTISPEGQKQSKFYKCTVLSAGRSIKLVSSRTVNRQSDPGHVRMKKTVTKISKRRPNGSGVSGQTVSSRTQESKQYSCRLCSFSSHLSRRIYQHMYSRHPHILDCPKCGHRSKTRTALFSHLQRRHSEEAKTLFNQNKVTKWIHITPKGRRKVNYNHMTPLLSALNEQDCPVNNYFVLSNHNKERSIHCLLCDYSFKKYHRSNANVYRSMYKHLFLRHIPHEFQCPICRFTHDREERIRKHMKERHSDDEQEPEIIVLSHRPTRNILYTHSLSEETSSIPVRQSRRVRKRNAKALTDYVTDFPP